MENTRTPSNSRGMYLMSTPVNTKVKPTTRSSKKKTTVEPEIKTDNFGASPVLLANRKRKNSSADNIGEPCSKRMADNQILEAINGIQKSVNAMENQMRNVPSRDDLSAIVTEIRGVRESVIRNTDRIDSLFDLRKEDVKILDKRVERIVDSKMASTSHTAHGRTDKTNEMNEMNFLLSRRTIRAWPVNIGTGGLDRAVGVFFRTVLKSLKTS